MKNKKLFYGLCGILTLLIMAGTIWFLTIWIPKIKANEHVLELIVIAVVLVLLFLLAIIFFYNTTSFSTKFAVKKGFNTAFSLIIFAVAGLFIAFGITQIVSYYNAEQKLTSVLTYGIASVVIGLVALFVSMFIKQQNLKIVEHEKRLEKINEKPAKPQTFNDTKINKTCEFCGCRLKPTDKHCPNCQAEIK